MDTEPTAAPRDEARRELTSMLGGGQLGAIPADLVVEHVLACYPDAQWPILREAARALLRRATSVEREGLRVATRPARGSFRGVYRTRRPRQPPRPYETRLNALRPMQVSCDCLDYQLGGLGLCKHGIAVVHDLASRPRLLGRALDSRPNGRGPAVCWDPVRAIGSDGDWLDGVRLRADVPLPRTVRRHLVDADDGWLRAHLQRDPKARAAFVDALEKTSRRDRDPALRALLRREREDHDRVEALRHTPAALRRVLASFRLTLYPYQVRGVEKFLATGRLLLADDMGLGKTVQAAAIAHTLAKRGAIRRALVLAPASLKSQWVREWRRGTDVSIDVIEGSPDDRRRQYEHTKKGVLVGNYEQVFRDLDLMRAWNPELVILDEAQRIKNWATLTARRVKQLDVPYRLVLTGTPLENRLDELASIMDWVDPAVVAPKWRLQPAHAITVDGGREVVGVRRLDALRRRLEPRMLRRRRGEILADLPERTDTVRSVEMTAAQHVEHDELAQPIARLVRAARTRPLTQPEFLRLMQLLNTQRVIANGLAQLNFPAVWPSVSDRRPDEAARASLSMPKLEHLRELVESIIVEQGRKAVVFSQWRRALTLAHWSVRDLLAEAGIRAAFFTGAESQRRRTQNVIELHDDPTLRILFCTDAGGVGLNLQRAASCCINFELPWNPAVFEQRVARLHRLGQPDPVDVYTLVSERSIEGRIASAVADKRALFTGLFDGDSDEVLFEGSGGFLGAVQAVAEPTLPPDDPDVADPDAPEPADDARIDAIVTSADERADNQRPTAARQRSPLPSAAEVERLFGELHVEPRPDGSLRLEASPRAARTLGALFSGMAALLERASESTPAERP